MSENKSIARKVMSGSTGVGSRSTIPRYALQTYAWKILESCYMLCESGTIYLYIHFYCGDIEMCEECMRAAKSMYNCKRCNEEGAYKCMQVLFIPSGRKFVKAMQKGIKEAWNEWMHVGIQTSVHRVQQPEWLHCKFLYHALHVLYEEIIKLYT